MDNKDPWVSYDKVSTSSDAFAYVQEIGNDLSDSLEHLNQGSPVRAKGLPTEKYTAGNTNDVMEGVHEESFLTQTPSKISRRYSPLTKSEYSGYRPPDPVFLSYNNNQTTNTFLPEPLAKHKTVDDIDKQQINNKFVVNKISSTSREAAIAPEALELINILNPIEAKEIQSNTFTQETITEKYTSSVKPIEVKKLETKINTVVQQSTPIVISKPKTLITNSQQSTTKIQEDTQSTNIINEVNELESTGPTYNNLNQNTNISSNTTFNIEVKKPVVTPKISQYTNTIDFNSFVSSTFAEIVDQKSEQKILSKNNINVRKLVTNINAFLEQNKKEFKSNLSNSVNDFFSTYSDESLTNLQSSILNTINTTNNIESLDSSVSRVVNQYFSKNQNEFSQSLVNEFTNSFSANLRTQLSVLQNNSATETNVLKNINNAINNVKNIYESKQVEIENIVSEVNNENILSKVVELANAYQEYQSLTTNSIQNISSEINQTNISELKEIFNQQVNNISAKTDIALSNYKQEIFGFLYSYISNNVSQDVFENLLNILNSSNTIEQINLSVNQFVSNVKTEDNSQAISSLQYYSNDKYSNIVSSLLVETIENNILKSLSNVVQNYSNPANIQNTLTNQVKNEIAEFFTSEIKNTVNKFDFAELKTSIENAYKSQDINEFKSEFNNALNKSENSSNSLAISHLNSLLENNLSQFTLKSANVLNETKYANSVKNIVNDNLHNVVSNIVNNLSEVNTYSENKNIATLLNNIKIINDRLLVNNAENRLQNFNLIQTSIDNFLSNTENNYNDKLSSIKLNTSNINSEILTNINIFESLKTDSNIEYLNEVKNIISTTNTQSFNEESRNFIDEVKVYTDLINMKNQITSELDNFVSNTFEAILEVNQNSTLISSQQVVNLIEEAVSTFNSSNVSSKAITHIKNVLNDVKRPELYSNTFQLITSNSILEEQVKNYLLQNNSILADYSLQQIMNTINQPLYSSYVTFQDIKEIINKSNSSSSFAILSEIKQYINQINSEENNQFVSSLKTYLNESNSNLQVKSSNEFTENLKNFINQQNVYSPESFNQIINSVSNKFENKSAVILNNIINENVSKFNQFVEALFSSANTAQSKEEILNTLSNFATSNNVFSDSVNNYLSEEVNSFKNENNDFVNKISEILNNNELIVNEDTKISIKNEIFNDLVEKLSSTLSFHNISNDYLNKIASSNSSLENKTYQIKNYLTDLEKTYSNSEISQNIKTYKITVNRDNLKFDILENIFKQNVENNFSFENAIQKSISKKYQSLFINSDYKNNSSSINQNNNNTEIYDIAKNIINNDFEFLLNRQNFINTSIDISSESQNNEQNYLTQNLLSNRFMDLTLQTGSFKFENEFKESIENIYNNSNEESIKNNFNAYKDEILNTAISNSLQVLNTSQTKIDSFENIIKNSSLSVEEKSNSILEILNNVINSKQYSLLETKNVEAVRNYFLNESFKIETLNKISYNDSFSAQDVEMYESEFNIRLQQHILTPSFIETISNLRNNIFESKNSSEIINFSDEQKTSILNDIKTVAVNIITTSYPEYLNTENYNILKTAESIEEVSNLLTETYNQTSTVTNFDGKIDNNVVLTNLLEQSIFMSKVHESIINLIQNESVINKSSLIQTFDNLIFTAIENKFEQLNSLLFQNAINNINQNVNEKTEFNQVNNELITSVIKNNLSHQKKYIEQILNSFKINSVSNQIQIQNDTVLKTLTTAVQNYNVAKLLTNTISENISLNQNIVNNQVIENVNKILEENGSIYNENRSSEELIQNISNNTNINEQILNTFNQNSLTNLFNQNLLFDISKNSTELRTLLFEKQNDNSIQLNDEYVNQIQNVLNSMAQTNAINNIENKVNNIENRIEKIENITLDFDNNTSYQTSKIEVYDEINNIAQTSIHPNYNQVNLSETSLNYESTNTDNEFKNITVVKQIEENEDIQISNLRIEKVWNKFIQEEVNKIVEEVNNSSESTINENTYNQQKSTVNQSNKTENFNNLEYNHLSNEKNNTENLNVYNTFNNQQPGTTTSTQETEERVDYREITELVFTKIEEKLKTFSITEEDIIILKHKILTEVTEIYEKRSQLDFKKSEEKMKKEMKDLFIRFLNS